VWGTNKRTVTKKQAATAQIHAAIAHLYAKQYECAITLACAAEDLIGDAKPSHLWTVLMARRPQDHSEREWATMLNETRDWLKHPTEGLGNERDIEEFETVIMLIRAVSKYAARFDDEYTHEMEEFVVWCREQSYAPK
jgi:hypothetical protein